MVVGILLRISFNVELSSEELVDYSSLFFFQSNRYPFKIKVSHAKKRRRKKSSVIVLIEKGLRSLLQLIVYILKRVRIGLLLLELDLDFIAEVEVFEFKVFSDHDIF
nr:MAG TPA: hypothetical protein [Caudoviricetes sp.]